MSQAALTGGHNTITELGGGNSVLTALVIENPELAGLPCGGFQALPVLMVPDKGDAEESLLFGPFFLMDREKARASRLAMDFAYEVLPHGCYAADLRAAAMSRHVNAALCMRTAGRGLKVRCWSSQTGDFTSWLGQTEIE